MLSVMNDSLRKQMGVRFNLEMRRLVRRRDEVTSLLGPARLDCGTVETRL